MPEVPFQTIDLVLQASSHVPQGPELIHVEGVVLQYAELRFQLRNDQHRSPGQRLLGPQDVPIYVIPYVQYLYEGVPRHYRSGW